MGERCEHGIEPASSCAECSDRAAVVHACVEGAYAQGRADERAAIVAWLGKDVAPRSVAEDIAAAIERGEYEKEKS